MILMACTLIVVIDGDTLKCDGQNVRLMGDGSPYESGFDTPETFKPKCQQELELGRAATARLAELLESATGIQDSGERDRYGRVLGSLLLQDGRTAGNVLVDEGYAEEWYPGVSSD